MKPVYQTHGIGDQKGMSDSFRKLERLALPDDMQGKTFLDIGCNEGFFCNVAATRGAKVIGIDFYKPSIDVARELYPSASIDFRVQSWDNLPEGHFDYVLWSSSMHYELNPRRVLEEILRRLTPTGVLFLECGVVPGVSLEMVRVNRHSDERWYPTEAFLTSQLLQPLFSFRQVAWPEVTEGDPIPRSAFHCRRRMPTVMLIRGASGTGKSTLTSSLAASVTKSVLVDLFLYRIKEADFHRTAFDKLVAEMFDPSDLTSLYHAIDEQGLTRDFCRALAEGIAADDNLVVFDGVLTDAQADCLVEILSERAVVWDLARRSSSAIT